MRDKIDLNTLKMFTYEYQKKTNIRKKNYLLVILFVTFSFKLKKDFQKIPSIVGV